MSDDPTSRHHKVIAMRIELGAEDLDIDDATAPQQTQRITNKNMFDDPLPKS